MSKDLTQGSLTKNLFYMALPTMGGFALQTLYDIADMFWIGRISSKAIAGVTVFSTVFWLVEVLNEIIGMSSTSLISQNYGAKDYERTNRIIEQTIVFKIFVAIIASAIMAVFLKPLMSFFSKDEEVIKAGLDYGYWRTFFMPVFFATYSTYTAQRMTGESRLPMMIMGTSAILNVILDPIFMFDRVPGLNLRGFNMGVSGAAVATVISTVVAFSWGFVSLMKGRGVIKIRLSGLFRLDREIDLKLLTIGLPSGIEMLMRSLSSAVLTKMLSLYGSSTLAVIGVVSRLMGLAFVPLMGFSMGASAIVGQNLGANKVQRAEKTVFLAALYGSLFVLVFVLVANFYPETIMNLFVHEKDVIREGVSAVRIGSWTMLIAAFSISLMSSFFGAGYTLPAMISSIIGRWAAQLPYVIIVVVFLRLPTTYVWFSFIVAEIAELLYALVVFSRGRWKEYRVR